MAAFGSAFGGAANVNPNKDVEVPSPPADGVSSLKFSPASNLLVATSWSGQVLCWDVQGNGQAIPKAAITSDKPVLCSAWSVDGSTVFAGEGPRAGRLGWAGLRLPAACFCVRMLERYSDLQYGLLCRGCGSIRSQRSAGQAWPCFFPPALSRAPRPAALLPGSGGCDNGVKMWNLATNQQQQVAQHAAPIRHCFFIRQVRPGHGWRQRRRQSTRGNSALGAACSWQNRLSGAVGSI